jgi:hypothetical protein
MPLEYEVTENGEHFRYKHHSLVAFYLEESHKNAIQALEEHQEGVMLSASVISLIFSCLAMEAFLNEIASRVLDDSEIELFLFCKGAFKKKKKESALKAKFRHMLNRKFEAELDSGLGACIDELSHLRNALVHYKMTEHATKYKVKAPKAPAGVIVADFLAPVELVQESFLKRITADAAVLGFNSVRDAINFLGRYEGIEDSTPGFERIA